MGPEQTIAADPCFRRAASRGTVGRVADDPELTARVRRALADVPDVVEKRMFGSIGFLVGGALRVGVGRHDDHVMMVRVAVEDADAALAQPGAKPAVMRGRPMRGWVFLEDEAVAADEQVARWVAVSLAAPV
jgi:TfoX/Sxy family transcriptional regulator of competence genes